MPIVPPRVIPISITSVIPTGFWNIDDGTGDPFISFPYQWQVIFLTTPISHSSHFTQTPFFYLGTDIVIGDWISSQVNGLSTKIISIDLSSATSVTCTVEDVDRFNTFTDPSGSGNGSPAFGPGFNFQVGDDGLPILTGIAAGVMSPSFQEDLVSRFRFRNRLKTFYSVEQTSHTFIIGDIIRIDSTETYFPATASSTAGSITGQINSVGTPGPDWFTYKPVGEVIETVSPVLPGVPGDLIYVDPTTPGARTTTKPSAFAKPIFIQLNAAGNIGILLNRNLEFIGEGGFTAQIFVVDDIPARDALDVNTGDQVYVIDASAIAADAGPGEFAHYLWNGTAFAKLTSQDASTTDSQTLSFPIDTTSFSVENLGRLSDGSRITLVSVDVTTPFNNANATLSVGDNLDLPDSEERFMPTSQNDLGVVDIYETTPAFQYNTGGSETNVNIYFDSGGSVIGEALVTITYS